MLLKKTQAFVKKSLFTKIMKSIQYFDYLPLTELHVSVFLKAYM